MISGADEILMQKACQTGKNAVQTIQTIVKKVADEELLSDLNSQAGHYLHFINRLEKKLRHEGGQVMETDRKEQLKQWIRIQAGTILNASNRHLASMVIEEDSRGVNELLRAIHDYGGRSGCEIAKELIDLEEEHMRQLQYYVHSSMAEK